jgi:calcium-dependent protein kinase
LELEDGFRNEFGEQVSKDEISQIFNMMDINRNGKIDYTEWVAATLDYDKIMKGQKIETAFEFFDKQNRKKIGIEELKLVIGSKRKAVEDQVYLSILREVDRDGDLELDL